MEQSLSKIIKMCKSKVILAFVLLISCTPPKVDSEGPLEFPLVDYKGVTHKYKDNFSKLIFPTHNEKLTQYCKVHREWENIKAVWSRDKVQGHYRWNYYVSKHKMSHKMRRR